MTIKRSTVALTISFLSLIFNTAGLTATNDLAYLAGMVVSILGLFAGALMSESETLEAKADREFADRLNKINNK
jgi:hypothetical protein